MSDWSTAAVTLAGAVIGGGIAIVGGWLQVRWTLDREDERQLRRCYHSLIDLERVFQRNAALVDEELPLHATLVDGEISLHLIQPHVPWPRLTEGVATAAAPCLARLPVDLQAAVYGATTKIDTYNTTLPLVRRPATQGVDLQDLIDQERVCLRLLGDAGQACHDAAARLKTYLAAHTATSAAHSPAR